MRTLGEIIELVKDGGKLGYDELRYAVIALEALSFFDMRAIDRLRNAIATPAGLKFVPNSIVLNQEESWKRHKSASDKSPKEWVGWENDPENPEYLKRRTVYKKLADKIIDRMESKAE